MFNRRATSCCRLHHCILLYINIFLTLSMLTQHSCPVAALSSTPTPGLWICVCRRAVDSFDRHLGCYRDQICDLCQLQGKLCQYLGHVSDKLTHRLNGQPLMDKQGHRDTDWLAEKHGGITEGEREDRRWLVTEIVRWTVFMEHKGQRTSGQTGWRNGNNWTG